MAHLEKFTLGSCRAILEHDTRTANHAYKNKDIDTTRSHLNYSLVKSDITAEERLKQRLSEVKVQKRSDVNVLCSWVVTLPSDVPKDKETDFFKYVNEYLVSQYGQNNVISSDVHYDETTPHLHFTFVPVIANKRRYKDPQKQPKYAYKVCADDLLTREHLKRFHGDLDAYLCEHGIQCAIRTGATTYNRSISELKNETAKQIQAEKDKQQELTEIAENNAREAIEIHKKASALEQQNIALESQIKRLSERRTERRKPTLGKVLLSATEYSELCDRADAVDNIKEAYTELRDAQTGKTITRLSDENKQLSQQNEQLRQEARTQTEINAQHVKRYGQQLSTIKTLEQENERLKKENKILTEIIEYVKDLIWEHLPERMRDALERIYIRAPRSRSRGR